MAHLRWLCVGMSVLLSAGWGCGGNAVTSGTPDSGTPDSGTSDGDTPSCTPACAAPPAGCHFVGEPTCDPPACPPIACDDAGTMDSSVDAACEINCSPPPSGCHFEGEATCDPPTCPPVVCEDAGLDAAVTDASLPDMDGFAGLLDGVWLIGWSGGMNHYSWVRMTGAPQWGGDADYLAGADLFANVPFWDCTGTGTWMVTAKPYTVGLQFPASCSLGFASYTFLSVEPPAAGPPNAILHATLEDPAMPGAVIEGFKFPATQCDQAMTTCQDPWQ